MTRHRRSGSRSQIRRQSGHRLTLVSGFTVDVHPLPPYYKDLIEEQYPLPDYPMRKISLAAGDVIDWPYDPPEQMPVEGSEDYDLYLRWKSVHAQREFVEEKRVKAKTDYLLATCVEIVDGPELVESQTWVSKVEAAFPDYKVPEHPGKRLLIFLKTQVITSPQELELLISLALSPEVTMQGIVRALQGFQDILEQGRYT